VTWIVYQRERLDVEVPTERIVGVFETHDVAMTCARQYLGDRVVVREVLAPCDCTKVSKGGSIVGRVPDPYCRMHRDPSAL
jgi:hypothetical protein